MFLRRVRRERRRDDASAVRKAVISSALTKPVGLPSLDIIVSAPRGVVSALAEVGWGAFAVGATRVTTVLWSAKINEIWIEAYLSSLCPVNSYLA